MPVESVQKQVERDECGRFMPGQSGNPAGRPHGARNKATEIAENLLDGRAGVLTERALELAMRGDPTALRLCLERIIPPRRQRPVRVELSPVRDATDLGPAMAAITMAATEGSITPGEGAHLARIVEIFVRAVETSDFERRLRELEKSRAARA